MYILIDFTHKYPLIILKSHRAQQELCIDSQIEILPKCFQNQLAQDRGNKEDNGREEMIIERGEKEYTDPEVTYSFMWRHVTVEICKRSVRAVLFIPLNMILIKY